MTVNLGGGFITNGLSGFHLVHETGGLWLDGLHSDIVLLNSDDEWEDGRSEENGDEHDSSPPGVRRHDVRSNVSAWLSNCVTKRSTHHGRPVST